MNPSPIDPARPPRVFVSYRRESDEHCARIGALVEKLRGHGFDATWDEREWPRVTGEVINWMRREVERADLVLMVFTQEYSRCYQGTAPEGTGMGAAFEAAVCALLLAENIAHNKKFLPVLTRPEDKAHLPPEIRNIPLIILDGDAQFDVLLRRMEAWLGMLPPLGPPDLGQRAVEALRRPWHPPRPPDRFIGRQEMVRSLAAQLIPGRRVTIVGAGGIGKTALASVGLAATAESREAPGPWLAGVCSHDYSAQPSHPAALAGLASQLGGAEIPDSHRAEFIRSRLNRRDAFLYLEGCERAEQLGQLLDLLPEATILLTSRDRQHAAGATPVELGAMPIGDAAQLLFHHAHAGAQPWPPVDSAEWETVAQCLGGHPLALRLAGQHLWLGKQTLEDLRSIMDRAGFAGFDMQTTERENLAWLFGRSASAVEKAHPAALRAWYVLALHALAPLPLAPIAAALGIGEDEARIHLRGLTMHSLVEVEPMPGEQIGQTEPGYRLSHSLLAEWGRAALPDWRPSVPPIGWKWWLFLFTKQPTLFDNPRLLRRWWDWWSDYLHRCFAAHCVPGGVARYAALQPHFSAILAHLRRIQGVDSAEVRVALMQIGQVQQSHGDFSAAGALLQQAADLIQSARGPAHLESLVALGNLADVLRVQGDYTAAEPLARRVLAGFECTAGPEAPTTLNALSNLALLLHEKAQTEEAEQLARRALALRERVLGAEHRETIVSLNNLALILQARGDMDGAEPLFRRALATCEQLHGADHPETLISVSNLASFLQAAGDLPAADPLYRRTLAGFERAYGPEHPATLTALANLGNFLHQKGDLAAAEPLYRRSLEIRKRVLPAGHPETWTSAFNLARLLEETGDLPAALAFARQALDGFRQRLSESHPHVQKAQQVVQRLTSSE